MIWKRALLATTLFYGLLATVAAFPYVRLFADIASILMLPGVWAIYSWAPSHSGSAFIGMNLFNLAFYYLIFAVLLAILSRRRSRRKYSEEAASER